MYKIPQKLKTCVQNYDSPEKTQSLFVLNVWVPLWFSGGRLHLQMTLTQTHWVISPYIHNHTPIVFLFTALIRKSTISFTSFQAVRHLSEGMGTVIFSQEL